MVHCACRVCKPAISILVACQATLCPIRLFSRQSTETTTKTSSKPCTARWDFRCSRTSIFKVQEFCSKTILGVLFINLYTVNHSILVNPFYLHACKLGCISLRIIIVIFLKKYRENKTDLPKAVVSPSILGLTQVEQYCSIADFTLTLSTRRSCTCSWLGHHYAPRNVGRTYFSSMLRISSASTVQFITLTLELSVLREIYCYAFSLFFNLVEPLASSQWTCHALTS